MESIIRYINPADLIAHPENKKYFDDIEGDLWEVFIDDVRQNGITEPLTVQTGTNVVLKGHQRRRAALVLKMQSVPVIYSDLDDESALDELIRDNVMRRDQKPYQKYKLVGFLQERIKSRQGEGGGNFSESDRTSVQIAQKFDPPRDQIAKLLGLHSKDIAVANLVGELPEEKQKEFYEWAKEFDPTRKKLEDKAKELRSENRSLRDVKKLLKKKEELETAVLVLNDELRGKTISPDQVAFFMLELEKNINWLRNESPKILNCEVPEEAITGFAVSIKDFLDQLDYYRQTLRKKFTYQE